MTNGSVTPTPAARARSPEAPQARSNLFQKSNAPGISWAGIIMLYLAIAAFIWAGYYSYIMRGYERLDLVRYAPELMLCGIGVFAALLGVKLVRVGGLSPSDPLPVVNPAEWAILSAAIKDNKDDPIGQYIRLSSLTGATGLFTKLGLSGLPLATIGLTLFFAVGSFWAPEAARFHELTQLTLGAFIGSFVQKQVSAVREAATSPTSTTSAPPSPPPPPLAGE